MKVGDLGRKGMKNACCGLCGYTGKLSRTHIPPKAAGNQGRARRLLELIDEHGTSHLHLKNAGTGGGGWGEWLCEPCNNKSGEWDEEYGEWSRNIVLGLHDGGVQHGRDLPMHLQNVAPGAVVRAMWAWMFALDPNLRLNEPDLAAAVLSGDPVEPPSDKKLLIGATTSLGIWVSGQVGGHAFRTPVGGRVPSYKTASGIRVVGPEEVDAPEVAVSSPPFVALLADASDDPRCATRTRPNGSAKMHVRGENSTSSCQSCSAWSRSTSSRSSPTRSSSGNSDHASTSAAASEIKLALANPDSVS
jgi:hypothetical protein